MCEPILDFMKQIKRMQKMTIVKKTLIETFI